jgi:hypothetical protein
MSENFNEEKVRVFFSDFLAKYREAVDRKHPSEKAMYSLFNSCPVKVDIIMDRNNSYGIIVLSKNSHTDFQIEKLPDPMMVVAMANSKKYVYGENRNFLYLFQVTPEKFQKWNVGDFVNDFVNYECAKNSPM